MQITVKWQGRIDEKARQHKTISSSPPLFHSTVQWNCSSFYYGLQLIKDVIKDVQVCLKDLSLVFLMHAQTHSLSPSISVSTSLSLSVCFIKAYKRVNVVLHFDPCNLKNHICLLRANLKW